MIVTESRLLWKLFGRNTQNRWTVWPICPVKIGIWNDPVLNLRIFKVTNYAHLACNDVLITGCKTNDGFPWLLNVLKVCCDLSIIKYVAVFSETNQSFIILYLNMYFNVNLFFILIQSFHGCLDPDSMPLIYLLKQICGESSFKYYLISLFCGSIDEALIQRYFR